MAELNASLPAEQTPSAEPAAPVLSHGQKAAAALATPPAVETVETPTVHPHVAKLAELGFENVADEKEAFDRLVSAYQTKHQVAEQVQAALAELKAQPTEFAPAPVQDAQQPSWKPPKIDKQLVAQYRTSDGWKEGTPDAIKHQYDAWVASRDKIATSFIDDPEEFLGPILEKRVTQLLEQRLNAVTAQQQEQTAIEKALTENAWLFEKDPVSGSVRRDKLSAEGQLFDQHYREMEGAGFDKAFKYAMAMHNLAKSQTQAKTETAAQTAAEINAQKKAEQIARAGGTPNRTGSLPLPSEGRRSQTNQQLRAGERFAQVARRDGLITAGT
jgi:hypothetical protein